MLTGAVNSASSTISSFNSALAAPVNVLGSAVSSVGNVVSSFISGFENSSVGYAASAFASWASNVPGDLGRGLASTVDEAIPYFKPLSGFYDINDPAIRNGKYFADAGITALTLAFTVNPFTGRGVVMVTRWGSAAEKASGEVKAGQWVMQGGKNLANYIKSGTINYTKFENGVTVTVPAKSLSYPGGWQWIKGLIGQRIFHG